jgi:hypothetical protein
VKARNSGEAEQSATHRSRASSPCPLRSPAIRATSLSVDLRAMGQMAGIAGKARRGTAEPRWVWSGVAPIIAPQLSTTTVKRLLTHLLSHRTPIKQIRSELRALGARYHRYLHQDEFGPSRAEQTAALRMLTTHFQLLSSQLAGLPRHLRLALCKHLAEAAPPEVLLGNDVGFQACINDEEAVQLVADVAFAHQNTTDEALTGYDAEIVAGLAAAAEHVAQLLWALDSTTSGAIMDELDLPPLNMTWDEESNFTIVRARIERLLRRVELALGRLERRHGPERAISLGLLVWALCNLYHRATGKPVTSSAVEDYRYTGVPQAPAGRFVLECVRAMQPPMSWMKDPDHQAPLPRARILGKPALARAVYFSMREYVARHPAQGPRRGRRKQAR